MSIVTPEEKFKNLLCQTYISNPDQKVVDTILTRFAHRLLVCGTPDNALHLYLDAKAVPDTTTLVVVAAETGLSINGPLSVEGSAVVLTGVEKDGKPVAVKILDSSCMNSFAVYSTIALYDYRIRT